MESKRGLYALICLGIVIGFVLGTAATGLWHVFIGNPWQHEWVRQVTNSLISLCFGYVLGFSDDGKN